MKSYIFDIFIICLVLGLLSTLTPERYKKAVSTAMGIILAAYLISPMVGLFEEIKYPELPEFSENGDGIYIDTAKAAFEDGIRNYIATEFAIDKECIEVEAVSFDFASMKAERLLVTLSGKGAFADTKKIKSSLEKENLGQIEIKIEL
jgi:hypothetical protein